MNDQSAPDDDSASTASPTKPISNSSERTKRHRKKLTTSDETRWEVHVYKNLKANVQSIAKNEQLDLGFTVQALLNLGISCYQKAVVDGDGKGKKLTLNDVLLSTLLPRLGPGMDREKHSVKPHLMQDSDSTT